MTFPDLHHLRQVQKDLWQWPKSRAAVMAGAGLSLNADPIPGVKTRLPDWRRLVRAMFDELHPPVPGERVGETKRREDRFNRTDPLRIASEYEATFNRRQLEALVRTQIADLNYQPGRLHQLLLR